MERIHGRVGAGQTPLGWMPRFQDIDWSGFPGISAEHFDELMRVDTEMWRAELESHGELFQKLQERLPKELILKRELFKMTLWR